MKLAALLLARIVIGECGFDATPADVAAHHAVLEARAERLGVSYVRAARLYSPRHTGVATSRRPWVAQLDRTLRRPPSWPSSASWERHRPEWERVLKLAERAHAGELEHGCDGRPDHWGGSVVDHERIERGVRRGYWRVVDCGRTRNVFVRIN